MVVALAAVTLSTAGSDGISAEALLGLSIPGWLASHQVPLTIGGYPFGVLPLLPTLILLWLVGTSVATAARRLAATAWTGLLLIAVTASAHCVLAVALAEAVTGGSAGAVLAVPSTSGLTAGLLAAVAAALGLLRAGVFGEWLDALPTSLRQGARVGLFVVAGLLAAGTSVLLIGLLSATPDVVGLFTQDRSGDAIGLLLCSLAYLPNAVIAGASFVLGPGFVFGETMVSPLAVRPGPILELPLLAALPTTSARSWWAVSLLLPIVVGLLVGRYCRRIDAARGDRLRILAWGLAMAAVLAALAAVLAGGRLGVGAFDPVRLPALGIALGVVGWTGIPAAVLVLVGHRVAESAAAVEAVAFARVRSEDGDESAEDELAEGTSEREPETDQPDADQRDTDSGTADETDPSVSAAKPETDEDDGPSAPDLGQQPRGGHDTVEPSAGSAAVPDTASERPAVEHEPGPDEPSEHAEVWPEDDQDAVPSTSAAGSAGNTSADRA